MAKTVVGLFENRNDAQAALRALQDAGFSQDQVNVVTSASGQFQSLLTRTGIPENDAMLYADGVQRGGALIILQAVGDRDAQRAADILDGYNIVDITRRQGFDTRTTTRDTSRSGMSNLYQGGDAVIPIIEEDLRIGKREVEGGGVRVNTRVEEVPVNEQVTLRDEEINVHRKPVNRPVSEADMAALQSGSFEVREHDEEAIVDKEARVVEELHVRKDVGERTETIQDTVRRTDVDVEQVGGTTRAVGSSGMTDQTSGEGSIERGSSRLGNAAERTLNTDLDRDGDVGQRDPRNNY